MTALGEVRTLSELVLLARERLAPQVWDYLIGGAESEMTQWRNRHALDAYAFLPRVLRDVSRITPETRIFGRQISMPAFLAPVGSLALFDKAAALASARAASTANVPFFMSIMAEPSLEEVARSAPGVLLILQIYIRGDRSWLDAIVGRAENTGCAALCLTVDTPVYGRRERDLRNRFSSATAVDRVNLDGRKSEQITSEQASLTWEDVAYLRKRTQLPLVIKGISTVQDATLAADHGVDCVYLSNHGGRQLDHAVAALDQLAAAREALPDTIELLVDGGFVRGTDIAKACALGARAAGFGKLQGLALAAGGEHGVRRMLELLLEEYSSVLALLGCARTDALTSEYVSSRPLPSSPGRSARPPLTSALGLD